MRKAIVNFDGNAASSANKTLVSKRINAPYRIKSMRVHFSAAADDTVQVLPFVSFDPSAPATTPPEGYNLLAEFGEQNYFTGDFEWVESFFDHPVKERGTYLKLYLINSAATTPHICCQIVIEIEE